MLVRLRFVAPVLLLLSCARSASSLEGEADVSQQPPRMRSLGIAGPRAQRPAPPSTGRRFAVTPTGNDARDCSEAAPCRQIQRAVRLATAPGDVVLVADGDYDRFSVDGVRGDSSRPITIFATGQNAVVRADPTCEKKRCRDTIVIRRSRHVVLDGLSSNDAPRAAVAVFYGSHVTIRNGRFGNNGRWGVFAMFSDDLTIEHNEIFATRREHGIYVSNSSDRPILRANVLRDNDGCGIHLNADFREKPESDRSGRNFYDGQADGIISGALIEGNLIYRNGSGVLGNKKRRGGAGINLDGVWDSVIRGNVLFDNAAMGIAAFGDADGIEDDSKEDGDGRFGPRGLEIAHNTVVMPEGARPALQIKLSRGTNVVQSNILFHRDRRRAGLDLPTKADAMLVTSNGNVLDRVLVSERLRQLDAWVRESGQDKQSISVPFGKLFVDPAGGDYTLLPASPAARAPTIDTLQQQRPQPQPLDFLGRAPSASRKRSVGACDVGR